LPERHCRENDVGSVDRFPLVILFGGGIESTTLTKRFLAEGRLVLPVYVNGDTLHNARWIE
jgi:hypothetical protein